MSEVTAMRVPSPSPHLERRGSVARRCADDGGAVIVEAALVLPLVLILLLGIFDFGMLYRQTQTLITSAQLMARSEANLANTPTADYNSVLGVRASLESLRNSTYDFVIVYKAPQTSLGTVPDPPSVACMNAATSQAPTYTAGRLGVSGQCNVYTRGMILATSAVGPGTRFATVAGSPPTCPTTSWHSRWCPTSRVNTQLGNSGAGPDHIGVYIRAQYEPMTGIMPGRSFSDYAVYRLEPVPIN